MIIFVCYVMCYCNHMGREEIEDKCDSRAKGEIYAEIHPYIY